MKLPAPRGAGGAAPLARRGLGPWHVIALTCLFILGYLLWRGPERFYYESWATYVTSPLIYLRLTPEPLHHHLLYGLLHYKIITGIFYAVPALLLGFALATGIVGVRKDSLACAVACFALAATVFVTYHFLQPMGMTVVYTDEPAAAEFSHLR